MNATSYPSGKRPNELRERPDAALRRDEDGHPKWKDGKVQLRRRPWFCSDCHGPQIGKPFKVVGKRFLCEDCAIQDDDVERLRARDIEPRMAEIQSREAVRRAQVDAANAFRVQRILRQKEKARWNVR